MIARLTGTVVLGVFLSTTVATAAISIDEKECKTAGAQYAPQSLHLRDLFFAAAHLSVTDEIVDLVHAGTLGTELYDKWKSKCLTAAEKCEPGDQAKADLYRNVSDTFDRGDFDSSVFELRIDRAALRQADSAGESARAFLNGNWGWLKVVCVKPPPPPPSDDGKDKNKDKKKKELLDALSNIVIAKSADDMDKAFKKRDFATLAYTDDRVKNSITTKIDLYVGIPTLFHGRSGDFFWAMRPGIGYQRQTGSKGVNNLSFDFSALAYPFLDSNEFAFKLGWVTDDKFKSSLWQGQFTWSTPLVELCEDHTTETLFPTCGLSLVADYVDVAKAGDKADLATMPSYLRLGAELSAELAIGLPNKSGFIVFGGKYSMRRDVDGHDADVDLGVLSLGYEPGDDSPVKIALEYTTGRDVTSLERQNILSFTFGFRH